VRIVAHLIGHGGLLYQAKQYLDLANILFPRPATSFPIRVIRVICGEHIVSFYEKSDFTFIGFVMRIIVWVLIAVLLIAHQDNFLWRNDTMVWGFMPIGLAYHAGISIAASVAWFLATQFCWPAENTENAKPMPRSSGGNRP